MCRRQSRGKEEATVRSSLLFDKADLIDLVHSCPRGGFLLALLHQGGLGYTLRWFCTQQANASAETLEDYVMVMKGTVSKCVSCLAVS